MFVRGLVVAVGAVAILERKAAYIVAVYVADGFIKTAKALAFDLGGRAQKNAHNLAVTVVVKGRVIGVELQSENGHFQ
jgi:hypothetical protein